MTQAEQSADLDRCEGSGQRYERRRFEGGYYRLCPFCNRYLLPSYGGVMPTHVVGSQPAQSADTEAVDGVDMCERLVAP